MKSNFVKTTFFSFLLMSFSAFGADITDPNLNIHWPTLDSGLSGVFNFNVGATDNVAVRRVEFYVNGKLVDQDFSSPFSVPIDSRKFANGVYYIKAIAFDAAGNSSVERLRVAFANPTDGTSPTVNIASPVSVSGGVKISATANDNVGVKFVEFWVNGSKRATVRYSPYEYNLNTDTLTTANVETKAFDYFDNVARKSITVSTPVTSKVLVPGHYMAGGKVYEPDYDYMPYVNQPNVKGIQLRYRWKDLETSLDRYDFSRIERDLAILGAARKRLIVMVVDKSFLQTETATPAYLDGHIYNYYGESGGREGEMVSGWVAKRWHPYVVARMKKLNMKLAERFDSEPFFEGVALQETALSTFLKDDPRVADYRAVDYANALIEVTNYSKGLFRNSNFFFYGNFLKGGNQLLYDVAEGYAPSGALMGGPDVTPDADGHIAFVDQYYRDLKRLYTNKKFCSMQRASYIHKHIDGPRVGQFWTMPELFNYAVNNYGCDYVIWNIKIGAPKLRDSAGNLENTTEDALDLISRVGSF